VRPIIVAPDSFKGTYGALAIANAIANGIRRVDPAIPIRIMPVADGGEGTLACVKKAVGGSYVHVPSFDPWMRPIESKYLLIDPSTALIELAQTAGLTLAGRKKDPSLTTTFGVGVQIRHAVLRGARTILLAIGGSATNDGGCGMVEALGVVFRNASGISFHPRGATLSQIAEIDEEGMLPQLQNVAFTVLCDVDNPLFGPQGAAHVYAHQKGADPAMVRLLDSELIAYAETLHRLKGFVADFPGAGAAGGTGVAAKAFLHAKIESGIRTLLTMYDVDSVLDDPALLFTGEGRLDHQSYRGKVLSGLLEKGKSKGVPVIVLAGTVDNSALPLPEGILEAYSIRSENESLSEVSKHTLERLEHLAETAVSRHYRN
jgi:glycerate kinase